MRNLQKSIASWWLYNPYHPLWAVKDQSVLSLALSPKGKSFRAEVAAVLGTVLSGRTYAISLPRKIPGSEIRDNGCPHRLSIEIF